MTTCSMQAATALLLQDKNAVIAALQSDLKQSRQEVDQQHILLAELKAKNAMLFEKLQIQKTDMEEMGKKFNLEFENIANEILETKTDKFTELNQKNLKNILHKYGVV